MKDKYLPIGTICTLEKSPAKYMIIGYCNISYNNSISFNDYIAVDYPEGLLKQKTVGFNHNEIKNIDFMGYKDATYVDFNNVLNNKRIVEKAQELIKISGIPMKNEETISNSYVSKVDNSEEKNPFQHNDELGNAKESKGWSIFKDLEFDANGVVIADNRFKDETNIDNIELASSKPKISGGLVFDENGVVVADNREDEKPKEINGLTFDSKGTVIEDNRKSSQTKEINGLVFDANGVVVADNRYRENGKISGGLVFDEDGVVVADNRENNK